MKKSYWFICCLSLSLLQVQCSKNGNGNSSVDYPTTILITSPGVGAIIMDGTTLKVEGEITDNNYLSTAKVEVKNKNTGAVLYQQSTATGSVSFYRFLWNWSVSGVSSGFPAIVRVTSKDKLNKEIYKEVEIVLTN